MKKTVAFIAFALLGTMLCGAQDWPQYQGPSRDGHSPETGLMRSWPAEGPEVLWSVDIGIGFGGPVIKDGKVYLLDRNDEVGDTMRCYDLATGKEQWNYSYDAPGSVMFPGSRSVPVIDGNKVYSVGPYGDLYCIDINSHQPVWKHNVWKDYGGGNIPTWAISQCPLVYGNLLIVASQAPGAGVVAYDKNTGAEVWKTPSLGPTGYSSPNLVKISGEDQIVMATASSPGGWGGGTPEKGHIVGLNPTDGKVLWDFDGWECHIPCGMVTLCGDNRMLMVGGYELGAVMIQVVKNADGSFTPKELFRTTAFGDQTKPAIFHDGYFYAMYRTNAKRDGLMCMDTEGNIKWKTSRNPNFDRGSIVIADELMLATDGASKLYLIEPSGEAFKKISEAELLIDGMPKNQGATPGPPGGGSAFGSQNWAPMALSGGKLLIRDQTHMLCVKVSK